MDSESQRAGARSFPISLAHVRKIPTLLDAMTMSFRLAGGRRVCHPPPMEPQEQFTCEKARRMGRKRALIGMAVMFVLAVGSVTAWVLGNSRDIPAPEVCDLTLQPRQLPPENAPYTLFVRAAARLM